MATFNSAGNGDFNADATWTESGQPGTADHAIIGAGHNVTMTADDEVGSIKISGTITGGGNTLTVNRASSNKPFDNDGTISGDLNVTITNTGAQQDGLLLDAMGSSGNINDLTLNLANGTTANKTVGIASATTIDGDLTITSGTFDTVFDGGASQVLTVTGEVNVAGTLTCNSSACSFGSLDSTGLTNLPDSSGSTLITNENSDGLSIVAGTYSTCVPAKIKHNNGTVTFNNHSDPAAHAAIVCGNSNATDGLYNVIIDGANTIVDTYDPGGSGQECKIHNNFTVTNGSFQVNSAGNPFDVGGDVLVSAGKMFGDGAAPTGAMSFGSLTIESGATFRATSGTTTITSEKTSSGYAWYNVSGTYTHNNGTVNFTSTADTHLRDDTFYNLTITGGASSSDFYYRPKDGGTGAVTIANDLTIVEGLFRPAGAAGALTVTGDVSIESGGVLGQDDSSGAMTFGSLTIASGGTYIATSGTTTIKGENSAGFAIQNLGTFTHNKGLVDIDFTSPTTTMASNGPYWDFTQSDAATDFYTEAVFEVMNNLYFVGDFDFQNNSHHLIVHGNMTIGNGTTTTRYMPYGTYTCNLTVDGILEVTNGATLTNFTHGTINVGGVRNTGGTM